MQLLVFKAGFGKRGRMVCMVLSVALVYASVKKVASCF